MYNNDRIIPENAVAEMLRLFCAFIIFYNFKAKCSIYYKVDICCSLHYTMPWFYLLKTGVKHGIIQSEQKKRTDNKQLKNNKTNIITNGKHIRRKKL